MKNVFTIFTVSIQLKQKHHCYWEFISVKKNLNTWKNVCVR